MKKTMKKKARTRREKSSGTLVMRGKYYTARVCCHGKVYTKSLRTDDKKEAERLLAEFAAPFRLKSERETVQALSYRAASLSAQIEDLRMKVELECGIDTVLSSSYQRQNVSSRTTTAYQGTYGRFCRWIKKNYPEVRYVADVTKRHAAAYMSLLNRKKLIDSTISCTIVSLKHFWKILLLEGVVKESIWENIRVPTPGRSCRMALTDEELQRIRTVLDTRARPAMKTLFLIGMNTGLREGDCACLRWESCFFDRGMIVLNPRKTPKTRVTIPLTPELKEHLLAIPEGKRSGYVLPELAEKYLSRHRALGDGIARIFRWAKIEKTVIDEKGRKRSARCFHSLRHAFASKLVASGMSLDIAKSILGHTDKAMTERYSHMEEQVLADGVMKAFGGAPQNQTEKSTSPSSTKAKLLELLDALDDSDLEKLLAMRKQKSA